jgi:hypothetical protein
MFSPLRQMLKDQISNIPPVFDFIPEIHPGTVSLYAPYLLGDFDPVHPRYPPYNV